MATPDPMPHPNDDRDHIAARAARQTFTEEAGKIRGNFNWSDSFKAEKIAALYKTHVTEVAAAYERLTKRRRKRLEYLESLVPVGPGIPADVSAADREALMGAWRSALETARKATPGERGKLLADAERFDDDMMRRAVLTTATDLSEIRLIEDWATRALGPEAREQMEEARTLRVVLAGTHFDALWDAQDFRPVPEPQEVTELPRLLAADRARYAAMRERR